MFPLGSHLFFLGFLTLEDGTDKVSRNVGTELQLRVMSQKSPDLMLLIAR